MPDRGLDTGLLRGMTALLSALALAGTIDLALDLGQDSLAHRAIGITFAILGFGGAAVLAVRLQRERRRLRNAETAIAAGQAESEAWHARANQLAAGLGAAIDRQFAAWQLTGAEGETALFLLKGYSHRDIARLTGRAERTVRQHSVAVYRKSGLAGRAELAAFFLEDLLLPPRDGDADALTASSSAGDPPRR